MRFAEHIMRLLEDRHSKKDLELSALDGTRRGRVIWKKDFSLINRDWNTVGNVAVDRKNWKALTTQCVIRSEWAAEIYLDR